MNTLTALKRSPLGLYLYLWLTYRTFALRAPQRLTWRLLYSQFGAHPAKSSDNNTVQAFRYKVLRELKKIKLALAGSELLDGSGRVDPAPFDPGHCAIGSQCPPRPAGVSGRRPGAGGPAGGREAGFWLRAERVEQDNQELRQERDGLIERIKERIAGIYRELQALPGAPGNGSRQTLVF